MLICEDKVKLQMSEILRANEDQLILSSIKACSVSGDIDGVEKYLDKFREHGEHVQEVCVAHMLSCLCSFVIVTCSFPNF